MQTQSASGCSSAVSTLCLVCADNFDEERLPTLVQCGHDAICSICYYRLRLLGREFSCPQCKQSAETVICTAEQGKRHADFEAWGEQIPGFYYDHTVRMFFPPEYHRTWIDPRKKSSCPSCKVVFRDPKALRMHVINEHKLQMCHLCIDFKHAFACEQKIYTQQQYETHLRKGDGDGGEGHPNCEFCKKRYYDKNALFQHLTRDHFSCHICEREGIQYRYYADYRNLEDHFRSEHIICEEASCLAKRFVVFADEISYSNHMICYHPQKSGKHKSINIQFHSSSRQQHQHLRRQESDDSYFASGCQSESSGSGRGPGQFDAGVAGRARNGEWQVELPQSARDPREGDRTADGRTQEFLAQWGHSPFAVTQSSVQQTEEEFPSLDSYSSRLGLGGGSSNLTDSDFPSIGGVSVPVIPQNWGGKIKTGKISGKSWSSKSSSTSIPQGPGRIDANATSSYRSVTGTIGWQSSGRGADTNLGDIDVANQYAAFAQYQPPYQSTQNAVTRTSSAPVVSKATAAAAIETFDSAPALSTQTFASEPISTPSMPVSLSDQLNLGRNIKINVKPSKQPVAASALEKKPPVDEPRLNELAYSKPPKKKDMIKQQQYNNISSLGNMLSSMGLGVKKPDTKAKQAGITGVVAGGGGSSSQKNVGGGGGAEVTGMIRNLKSELRGSSKPGATPPPPPGFHAPSSSSSSTVSPPPPPGFSGINSLPTQPVSGSGGNETMTATSTKKPENWTKIGGTSQSRPVETPKPSNLSASEYPSLPPAPPQTETNANWTSAKTGGRKGAPGSGFAVMAAKTPATKPANCISVSVSGTSAVRGSGTASNDAKGGNASAKGKKGINKKVRQDLLSAMTGK